jgi:hypothetical protein
MTEILVRLVGFGMICFAAGMATARHDGYTWVIYVAAIVVFVLLVLDSRLPRAAVPEGNQNG